MRPGPQVQTGLPQGNPACGCCMPQNPSEGTRLHFQPSEGRGKIPHEEALSSPSLGCHVLSALLGIASAHLPDHHVLGSSSHGADPVLAVLPHQAVCMQVDAFPICDQLNNNLCRSHIVADLCKKHILKVSESDSTAVQKNA